MSKHIETLIKDLLPTALASDLDLHEKRFDLETKLCPTMARIAVIARSFEASDKEEDHIAACAHCSARIKAFRSELHPSLLSLVMTTLNLAAETDRQRVVAHLQDRCEECSRLLHTSWVKGIIAGFTAGRITMRKLADGLAQAHYRMSQLPALSLRYAETESLAKPFHTQFKEGDFSIALEETDSDDLFVRITVANRQLKDQVIHLELFGERTNLEANIRLEPANSGLEGIHIFPDFGSARDNLGTALILAVPALTDV